MTGSKAYSIGDAGEETNMTNLVIVESGAKGKKIQAYLGRLHRRIMPRARSGSPRPGPDRKQANKAMWASRDDALRATVGMDRS